MTYPILEFDPDRIAKIEPTKTAPVPGKVKPLGLTGATTSPAPATVELPNAGAKTGPTTAEPAKTEPPAAKPAVR